MPDRVDDMEQETLEVQVLAITKKHQSLPGVETSEPMRVLVSARSPRTASQFPKKLF